MPRGIERSQGTRQQHPLVLVLGLYLALALSALLLAISPSDASNAQAHEINDGSTANLERVLFKRGWLGKMKKKISPGPIISDGYYTNLEPTPPSNPRVLKYANLYNDGDNLFYFKGGSATLDQLSMSDYPLGIFSFELSEYSGDDAPKDAADSSTDYKTAFRVTLTVYSAPNKTADLGTKVKISLYFEEGDTRKSVRMSYTNDEGEEDSTDFKKDTPDDRPFARSSNSLTLYTDGTGSVVLHVPATAGSLSCPPLVAIIGDSTDAVFLGYPDEHVMNDQLNDPTSYAQDGKAPLMDSSSASSVANTVGQIADASKDSLGTALVTMIEDANKSRRKRLARRGEAALEPIDEFAKILDEASMTELNSRAKEWEKTKKMIRLRARGMQEDIADEEKAQRRLERRIFGKVGKALSGAGKSISKGVSDAGKSISKGAEDVYDKASKGVENTIKKVTPVINVGIDYGKDFLKDPVSGVQYAIAEGAKDLGPALGPMLKGVNQAYYITAKDFKKVAGSAGKSLNVAVQKLDKGFAVVLKAADQLYAAAVTSVQLAIKAIEGVFNNFIAALDKILDYIKSLIFAAFKAIFGNARALKGYIDISTDIAKKTIDAGAKYANEKMDDLADQVEETMDKAATKITKQVASLKLSFGKTPAIFNSLSSIGSYVMHMLMKGVKAAMKVVSSAVSKVLKAAFGKNADAVVKMVSSIPCADELADVMKKMGNTFKDIGDISKLIGAFAKLMGTVTGDALRCAGDVILFVTGDIIDPILDLWKIIFTTKIKIPFLSDVWKLITGMNFSFSAMMALIGSLAGSIASLAATGKIYTVKSGYSASDLASALIPTSRGSRLEARKFDQDTFDTGVYVSSIFKGLFNIVSAVLNGIEAYEGKSPLPEEFKPVFDFGVNLISFPLAAAVAPPYDPLSMTGFFYWSWHVMSIAVDGVMKVTGHEKDSKGQVWNHINVIGHLMGALGNFYAWAFGGGLGGKGTYDSGVSKTEMDFIMVETVAQLLALGELVDKVAPISGGSRLMEKRSLAHESESKELIAVDTNTNLIKRGESSNMDRVFAGMKAAGAVLEATVAIFEVTEACKGLDDQ